MYQWLAVIVTVCLTAGLYIWGEQTFLEGGETQSGLRQAPATDEASSSVDMEALLAHWENQLPVQQRTHMIMLRDSLRKATDAVEQAAIIDELVHYWRQAGRFGAAAFFLKQKAQLEEQTKTWLAAGDMFSHAFRNTDTLKATFAKEAIACYEQALELEPANLQAKVSQAICYTDGTNKVMHGVNLLLDVVAVDSTHVRANFHLGRLAIRSGQADKAEKRLETVLERAPENLEALLLLGEAYLQQGNNAKAVQVFEQCRDLADDPKIKHRLDSYIQEISKRKESNTGKRLEES